MDLFDEGFDVPGIECVSIARATKSTSKIRQIYGRGLRPVYTKGYDLESVAGRLAAMAAGPKRKCLIIDHVGMLADHGPPDSHMRWNLDSRKRKRVEVSKNCWNIPACGFPFLKILTECPYCGAPAINPNKTAGGGRITPQMVDGDLALLSSDMIREIYAHCMLEDPGIVGKRVTDAMGYGLGKKAAHNQQMRINVAAELAEVIAVWAGKLKDQGYSDRMMNKDFYRHFETTIPEALSMTEGEMKKMIEEMEL